MREARALVLAVAFGFGCTTPAPAERVSFKEARLLTADGLRRVEIDMPGVLFIRDDHEIGSYDALLVPKAGLSYKRRSARLARETEQEFLATLEQSLVDLAVDADIPVVEAPGQCVMQIGIALHDMDLDRRNTARTLGRMVLVMEFRDSDSGQPLLRYASQNVVTNDGSGSSREDQIRDSFYGMVERMNVGGALRAAGLGDDTLRAGCTGLLAQRGRAATPPVSAR